MRVRETAIAGLTYLMQNDEPADPDPVAEFRNRTQAIAMLGTLGETLEGAWGEAITRFLLVEHSGRRWRCRGATLNIDRRTACESGVWTVFMRPGSVRKRPVAPSETPVEMQAPRTARCLVEFWTLSRFEHSILAT